MTTRSTIAEIVTQDLIQPTKVCFCLVRYPKSAELTGGSSCFKNVKICASLTLINGL